MGRVRVPTEQMTPSCGLHLVNRGQEKFLIRLDSPPPGPHLAEVQILLTEKERLGQSNLFVCTGTPTESP